jgi:fructosamine-3-kinase
MIYHTSPDSEEVEMIGAKAGYDTGNEPIFNTEKEAWDWFHANYRIHHFIQPEAVRIHIGTFALSRQE